MITRRSVRRALGLAAFLAAARVAWWHHTDNQLVILTDAVRDAGRTAFAAGQAAERNRRTEEERTARVWTGLGLDWSGLGLDLSDPYAPPTAGPLVIQREGQPPELIDPEEPEGPGWTEHDDRYGGTSR